MTQLLRSLCAALALLVLASCVNVDPETGKTIPRGNQRYEYAKVKEMAERLQKGMTRLQVLTLLGSPAETKDNVWIYLPERPAVLVPSSALRLSFGVQRLESWEFRTIVLGQQI